MLNYVKNMKINRRIPDRCLDTAMKTMKTSFYLPLVSVVGKKLNEPTEGKGEFGKIVTLTIKITESKHNMHTLYCSSC